MTSVAILISNAKGNGGASCSTTTGITTACTANIVVWASTPLRRNIGSSSTNNHRGGGVELTYYQYYDHSYQFSHTNALLQRLAGDDEEISVIHVASALHINSSSSNSRKKSTSGTTSNSSIDRSTQRLLRVLEESVPSKDATLLYNNNNENPYDQDGGDDTDRTSSTTAAASAAKTCIVQYHDTYKPVNNVVTASSELSRLSSIMEQLVQQPPSPPPPHGATETTILSPNDDGTSTSTTTTTAQQVWLQLMGDVAWQQHSEIASGLIFYLHTMNQWPVANPTAMVRGPITAITKGHLNDILSLDSTAAEAIHLWPPATVGQQCVTGGTMTNNSIYGVLSSACRTAAGKRRLQQWLRQPLVSLSHIVARQDAVALLVQESVARDALRESALRQFASTDLSKLAMTLSKYATSTPNEHDGALSDENAAETAVSRNSRRALVAMYELYLVSSQKVPLLTEHLETVLASTTPPTESTEESDTSAGILAGILSTLQQCRGELERSVELIEAVLDLEQAPREFLVQADYKEELRDILAELDQVQDEIDDCHASMNQIWAEASGVSINPGGTPPVRLEATSDDGTSTWQFRLPNTNDSKILQHQLAGTVVVHRILKNGVYFSTKELRHLSTKQQDLRAEYDRHQLAVVLDAAAVAATYCPILEQAGDAISYLDAIAALAHTAAYSPHGYCRPIMTDSEEDGNGIDLKAARHPCVELQDSVDFIPNDCKLLFGESSFLLVTGPNMGGKSTYIRALGAIVTMAQIGSFVPCASAKINICHHILARVGAGDLQERGISTFMAEMLESSSILRTATKRSLIIIDELGRGTSTFDGYGLARAISEYIVQKIGCMTVFATHFHELTVLEDQEASVKNCHVTAQKGSQGLTFLYEVKPGPCLESFGIQVAEMAHVPNVVIQDAKRRARELENFEYRKKARATSPPIDPTEASNEHDSAEAASAAVAFVNRFRRLPRDFFSTPYHSEDEKRAAFAKLLEA